MAVTADKDPPESVSYSERIIDFSGGLNTTISGSLLNSNEAQIAKNLSLEQKGTLRPRKGRTKRYSTVFTPNPVTGLGVYYKNDGTSRVIVSAGDALYSDAPHMSTRWDAKADWEQTNVQLSGFASVSQTEGSVTARKQAFGVAAKTADATLWTALDSTLSVKADDSTYKDGDCVEVLISADKTSGYAYKTGGHDTTKYVAVTAYIKNFNATTGVRIVGLTTGNSVSKSSDYVTGTSWTKVTLKLTPAEALNVTSFGIQVTGTAGQYAYFCGLFYEYISDTDYANTTFVAHDLTYYDVFKRDYSFKDKAGFDTGTYTHVESVNDVLKLSVEIPTNSITQTSQAEFNAGTLTNVSTTELVNSVVLARQT